MMQSRGFIPSYLLAVALTATCGAPAFAIDPSDLDTLQKRLDQQSAAERAAERTKRNPDVDKGAGEDGAQGQSTPLATAPGGPCFTIRTVTISGYEPFRKKPKGEADLLGRCATAADIAGTLNRINEAYQKDGYITTRAYVPEQDLSKGALEIVVVPGRIEGYVYADGRKADDRLTRAFPTGRGDLLNLRDLEQGLDNINGPHSAKGKFQLVPGEKTGGSFVQVNIQDGPRLHGSLETKNTGFKTTGVVKSTATVTYDNPAKINDQVTLSLTTTPFDPRVERFSDAVSLNSTMPLGNWSLGMEAGVSRYFFILDGVNQSYPVEGNTVYGTVSAERLLSRNQTTKTYLYGKLKLAASRSYIEGYEIESQHRDLTIGTLGFRGETAVGQGKFTWDMGLKSGLGLMDHVPVKSAVDEHFLMSFASLTYEQPLTPALTYKGTLTGQFSEDVLPGSEQISIGGWGDVRGFHDDSMYGDSGVYLASTLEWTAYEGNKIKVVVSPGLDVGAIVPSVFRDWDQHYLVGASLGLGVTFDERIDFTFKLAQALSRPSDFQAGRTVAYAGLNFKF